MEILKGSAPNSSNYKRGRTAKIEYIVIHYTGNKGDTAYNNVKYFANNIVKASAHFFVDESYIYSSVPVTDTAWHCGGNKQSKNGGSWYGKCTNSNSIGVEMCLLRKDGTVNLKTMLNAVELTKQLMTEHNIPAKNVIRHWDVVGKDCPKPFTGDDNAYWQDFKNRISVNEVKQEGGNSVKNEKIYNSVDEVLEFAKPTIQKLCDKGFLKGTDTGLNLTYDMIRILVILDRTGVFD